jgi:steroid 5-alpha reductase family enzyme
MSHSAEVIHRLAFTTFTFPAGGASKKRKELEHTSAILLTTFGATMAMMLVLWFVSLAIKNASIVDIFWGAGFVVIAAVTFALSDGYPTRKSLITALAAIWGLRLAIHIGWRNHGKGEDFRYKAMRKRYGDRFALVSLYTVFGLQGILMWVISLPLQFAQLSREPARLTWLDFLGAAFWLIGLSFEAIGDLQLTLFRVNRANKGKVMDRGLWAYTRHPNYFGDALLWWGFFLIALATPRGWWTVISPVLMTTLLMKVSGVALLEKTLVKTRPEYQGYVRRTSAFFPLPPKR